MNICWFSVISHDFLCHHSSGAKILQPTTIKKKTQTTLSMRKVENKINDLTIKYIAMRLSNVFIWL